MFDASLDCHSLTPELKTLEDLISYDRYMKDDPALGAAPGGKETCNRAVRRDRIHGRGFRRSAAAEITVTSRPTGNGSMNV